MTLGRSFAAQFSAGCTTNMSGFDFPTGTAADGFIDEVGLDATICAASLTTAGSLHNIQRARILMVYAETAGNISETARRLGVSRNTIYRALEQTPG
jgi:transcriptional regulator of acetoin/glycerol metabolism